MDPDRYCIDEAAPPGSSLYYAVLFTGARERAAFVAIHALRRTLVQIVDSIADRNVRARKLNWWSDEIMEARDGRARHPVSISVSRHCGERLWKRPEVLAMLSAVVGVSAEDGFVSEAARSEFCRHVGGGTAQLCTTAAAVESGGATHDAIRLLGTALEEAILASVPVVSSRLKCIFDPAPETRKRPAGDDARGTTQRIVQERIRARESLAGAVRDMPRDTDSATLVYRTLACIQLAALANALRNPAREAPSTASITPIRKLWIAWRTARRKG